MGKHLSIRLPWHDRGWDGCVCDHPMANVYCSGEYGLKAHGIAEKKLGDVEELISSKPCQTIKGDDYVPPCLRTIQTFGGTGPLKFVHEPKDFLSTAECPVSPIPEDIPPCTAGTWPYDRVFRREEADEGTPEEFEDRYSPEEAKRNLKSFLAGLERGLAFFYLNYDNPLNSERRRYVLVGASEIDSVSLQHEWEGMEPERARKYGTFVWNRFITHGYGEGRGARLPYDRYLQQKLDPSGILLEVPDELSRHFKYVCRSFTDDEAAIMLQELLGALERGKAEGRVPWDWDKQIAWINTALDRVWTDRGFFPGLGPVLEAIGFPGATLYVKRSIVEKGIQDPRQHVLDRLAKPDLAETAEAKKGFERAEKTLRLLPASTKELLLDRLALMELTTEQVKCIASGLVSEDERVAAGLRFTAAEALENPYLIIEQYDPVGDEDPIPFYRVDNGMFLPKSRNGVPVPGLDGYLPDDPRRLRAAAHARLRHAARDGHSFLPQEDVLAYLSHLKLPGVVGSIGTVTLARDLEFFEQIFMVQREGDLVAWMLRTVFEDEELIRERVSKLRRKKLIDPGAVNWDVHLPKPHPRLPKAVLARARETQRQVLDRLIRQPFSVLIGGAGTGKTSVVAALISALRAGKCKEKFLLLTPTGKAAVRLKRRIMDVAEVELEPRTLHSYLVSGAWMDGDTFRTRREGPPVSDGTTTVVIDECSMLDVPMLATIFRALDWLQVRRLILCGDPQQLPPIGLGAPFRNIVDVLASSDEPASQPCALTVNCRQAQEQSTALNLAQQFAGVQSREVADELLDQLRAGGRIGTDLEVRFFKDEHDLPEVLTTLAVDAVGELLTLEGLDATVDPERFYDAYDRLHRVNGKVEDVRLDAFEVLSPYRGNYFGSDALNRHIQFLLRERLLAGKYIKALGKASGRRYVWPDKVLQTQNVRIKVRDKLAWDGKKNVDFFVANGELGRVKKIGRCGRDKIAWVHFETSPLITVSVDEAWGELLMDLGYAMTVHKAQGSDFGGVVVVIPKEERQRLVSRELLYTALTRFTGRLYLLVQGEPGDLGSLFRGLWLGASDHLRRNTSLYGLRRAVEDLEDFRPEQRIHTTLRAELVRSKSEALIANQLHAHKLGYHYEKLLVAPDGSFRRPDFTVPIETPDGADVRYWEHWGMLGDPAYDVTVKRRIAWYEKHGLADKLIQSDERGGFDSIKIDRIIREHLLP